MTVSSSTSASTWTQKWSGAPGRVRWTSACSAAARSAGRADGGEIEGEERIGKRLAAVAGLFLRVAEADDDRVLGADEWRAALEVADRGRTVAGGQREVHRRRLARGLGRRLVEVGVPVEEQETGGGAAAQRECPTEQHAAVATEDERNVAGVEHRPDRVGEGDGIRGDLRPVEHAALGIADPGCGRGRDRRGDACAERPRQAVPEQRVPESLHSWRAQPEPRGRPDDGETDGGREAGRASRAERLTPRSAR